MAIIDTPTGSFEVLELHGPRPGVIWMNPWQLSQTIEIPPKEGRKGKIVERWTVTIGLALQGRGGSLPKREPDSGQGGSRDQDDDEEQYAGQTAGERRARQFREEEQGSHQTTQQQRVKQAGFYQEFGSDLPASLSPPNDVGFILVTTDRGEIGTDVALGTRTANEKWSLIDDAHRVRLLPKIPMEDPLWGPRFVRFWLWEGCIPWYLRAVANPGPGRRPLLVAIPDGEPRRSQAIEILQRAFANEKKNRSLCHVRGPQAMDLASAALMFGLVDEKTMYDYQHGTEVIIRKEGMRGERALTSKRVAQEKIVNATRDMKFERLHGRYMELWKQCDPQTMSDPETEPAKYEELSRRCFLLQDAYERILFSRMLKRNPLTKVGPSIVARPYVGTDAEKTEGLRQLQKILTFDPSTKRISIKRDARWKWNLGKKTIEIDRDEEGVMKVIRMSTNIASWIFYVFGVVPVPDVLDVTEEDSGALGNLFDNVWM
jgi:hypothetical protein